MTMHCGLGSYEWCQKYFMPAGRERVVTQGAEQVWVLLGRPQHASGTPAALAVTLAVYATQAGNTWVDTSIMIVSAVHCCNEAVSRFVILILGVVFPLSVQFHVYLMAPPQARVHGCPC